MTGHLSSISLICILSLLESMQVKLGLNIINIEISGGDPGDLSMLIECIMTISKEFHHF